VQLFIKKDYDRTFDMGDDSLNHKAMVYGRNYAFDLAKELGMKYFLVLDDDYLAIHYRAMIKTQ